MEEKFYREGLSRDLIELQRTVNPARAYAPNIFLTPTPYPTGTRFRSEIIHSAVSGHRGTLPGHTCLYMEKEKILFCGDHILFDITPNITMWRGVEDSLGNYLESLKKIKALDIRLALPAHRKNDMDVYERIRQIEEHHARRIHQTLSIVREKPGLNACQIGARMTWSMRGKNWDEFPIQQKWFAIGETISHLDYLMKRGLITRHDEKEIIYYTANQMTN